MPENDILPVILGASDGAYALCRAFHHDYGIFPLVIDEEMPELFLYSGCAMALPVCHVRNERILMYVLEDIAAKNRGKSLLLIPAVPAFLTIAVKRKEDLEKLFLMPHLPTPTIDRLTSSPFAVAFLYRAEDGTCRTAYAEVCALAENGNVLAALAAPIPSDAEAFLQERSKTLSRGCYLFYLTKQGSETRFIQESAPLHPLMAFLGALDASIPEWMACETVLVSELPAVDETLCGVFSLFPIRKIRSRIFSHKRACVAARVRAGGALSLYCLKNERFSLRLHKVFRAYRASFGTKKDFLKK